MLRGLQSMLALVKHGQAQGHLNTPPDRCATTKPMGHARLHRSPRKIQCRHHGTCQLGAGLRLKKTRFGPGSWCSPVRLSLSPLTEVRFYSWLRTSLLGQPSGGVLLSVGIGIHNESFQHHPHSPDLIETSDEAGLYTPYSHSQQS